MTTGGGETEPPATDGDRRNETRAEQLDRNWLELLQELRVMQTGVQVMAGFLLTLPFQQRFSKLDAGQVALYLALVIVAAAATGLMMVPVALHRRLFRHKVKAKLVEAGNRILKVAVGLVAALVTGATALTFYVVTNGVISAIAAVAVGLALAAGLLLYPMLVWHPSHHELRSTEPRDATHED
ncbi:DUF6328 family protein [Specibacter cremeus]|uniref:DUF6328 family protein n=1 Tax=Specibacter cremeus TaxID=1629051 RepID=UPI000F78BE39|nr:DUF6328 family protein [Specibacter cremeus]